MCVYVFVYIIKIQPLHKHKIYYDELLADHEFTQTKFAKLNCVQRETREKGGGGDISRKGNMGIRCHSSPLSTHVA